MIEDLIPKGSYCYTPLTGLVDGRMKIKLCPFWKLIKDRRYQENGYCLFMQKGDWGDNGTFILWDQCKECNINDDFEEEI